MEKLTFSDKVRLTTEPLLLPIVKLLLKLKIRPNHLTLTCLFGFAVAAVFVAQGNFLIAGLILLLFSPFDALDGMLARYGNMVTTFGAFLDSTLDRYGEIFIFLAFVLFYLWLNSPAGVILAFLALTGSLMVSYTRARAEGLGLKCKVGLLTRFERILMLIVALFLDAIFLYLVIISVFTHLTAFQRIWYVFKQTSKK